MPTLDKDQYTKAEAEELLRENEEKHAEDLDVAKREAQMNDAEKAVYKTLEGDAKSEFLFATADERAAEILKADDDDPVVYKSVTGTEFRKSDDPRLVAMAKERDTERKDFLKMQAERVQESFEKRAEEKLPNLPGDVKTRAAILKAIEGISDEDVRKAALESIKAQNAKMAKAFTEVGAGGVRKGDNPNENSEGNTNAHEELDGLAKEHVKANPDVNYYTAYDLVATANPELAKRAVQEG